MTDIVVDLMLQAWLDALGQVYRRAGLIAATSCLLVPVLAIVLTVVTLRA